MWESGGERKEKEEGAGIEYQVEEGGDKEYTIVMCVRLALIIIQTIQNKRILEVRTVTEQRWG